MARVADTLAGRYELLDVIGRGGMGVVYRARDRVLERTVAVKLLPAEYAEDLTLVERFSREARAAASLSDPRIVAVFDTGRDADARYIVMELVDGVSLAQLLGERGALPVDQAVEIGAQTATALAAAHAAGIVHRDIKPGNVMVQPSGAVKVLDFGIAHAAEDHALTRTTMILGSAPYIPPEVARGGSADERSDIYSLGCVLYEMLTGRPPFTGDQAAAVMYQQVNAAPEPARALQPAVPHPLDALLMRMLAKDPAERPQRAAELVPALRGSLREPDAAPTMVAAPLPRPAPTAVAPPPRLAPTAVAPPPSRSRAWIVLAAAITALAVGVAVALASSSGSSPSGQTRSSSASQHHRRTSTAGTPTHGQTASSTATTPPSTRSATTSTSPTTSSVSSTTSSTGTASATSTTTSSPANPTQP